MFALRLMRSTHIDMLNARAPQDGGRTSACSMPICVCVCACVCTYIGWREDECMLQTFPAAVVARVLDPKPGEKV